MDQGNRKPGHREDGFALLMAVIVAVLLSLIGLSLTTASLNEYFMATEFNAHEQALIIADTGMNMAKDAMRGKDMTTTLSTAVSVPTYLPYTEPTAGSYEARNPLPLLEARNVNFDHPPYSTTARQVYGMITPPGGIALGGGRFFARVSDNFDEIAGLSGANNPLVDVDQTVYLRVMAVHRGAVSDAPGGALLGTNAIAILEALLRRDASFDMASPLLLQGPAVNATFDGNAFSIIGDAQHPAIGVIRNDPTTGDAATAYNNVRDALILNTAGQSTQWKGTVRGEKGPDGISLMDVTSRIRSSGNDDATNVFDPLFLQTIVNYLPYFADNVYFDNTRLSGGPIELGTTAKPEITVALGDLNLAGGGSGAGLLVVMGEFNYSGAFDFDGIILVVGEGVLDMSGASKTVTGGVFVSNIEQNADGSLSFGIPSIRVDGNSNFIFASDSIRMAVNMFPLETVSLREITPEVEPGAMPANTQLMSTSY